MPKTVLIVEDNELNMKLFNDLLEAHGYATLKTGHGIEAMELARAHKPDLILMDIQLPEVSGLEVTRWLKQDEELKGIPVIAITAFAMKGDEERIREGGCEAYLSKPISVAKFIATVQDLSRRRIAGLTGFAGAPLRGRPVLTLTGFGCGAWPCRSLHWARAAVLSPSSSLCLQQRS